MKTQKHQGGYSQEALVKVVIHKKEVISKDGMATLTSDAAQRAPTEDAAATIDQIARIIPTGGLATILTFFPFNVVVGWAGKRAGVANMILKIRKAVSLVIARAPPNFSPTLRICFLPHHLSHLSPSPNRE